MNRIEIEKQFPGLTYAEVDDAHRQNVIALRSQLVLQPDNRSLYRTVALIETIKALAEIRDALLEQQGM